MVTLVCGIADEAPVAMLIEALRRVGAEFLVLDQRTLADEVRLRWQVGGSGPTGSLWVRGQTVDIPEIRSVYHRFMNPEEVEECNASPPLLKRSRSIMHSLMDLFDVLPARIVNRRRPMMSNNSKPYQALLIREAGFAIPETFITNDPHALTEFASQKGPLIYKSISSERSIVAPLDGRSLSRVESLPLLPTQFQRKIEGFNVRVHVVGNRCFATRIVTSATDYRYAALDELEAEFSPYELTDDLRKQCLRLVRLSGLAFTGIDLMIAPGRVYCLEFNPSPGYSYYQNVTGQPISDALARFLSRD